MAKMVEVKAALAEIETKLGTLTPEVVVDAAKDPDSILHEYFEWDNKVAGAAYRIEQARALIRRVKVEVVTETVTVRAPAYVRDPRVPRKETGYVSLKRVSHDEDLSRKACLREFEAAGAHLKRARDIAAALDLAEEFQDMLAEYDRLGDVIRKGKAVKRARGRGRSQKGENRVSV